MAKARPRWAAAQRRFETTFGTEAAVELRAVLEEVATRNSASHCDNHPGFKLDIGLLRTEREMRVLVVGAGAISGYFGAPGTQAGALKAA